MRSSSLLAIITAVPLALTLGCNGGSVGNGLGKTDNQDGGGGPPPTTDSWGSGGTKDTGTKKPPPGPCNHCVHKNAGAGGDPFDPAGNDSDGVGVDKDGALVINKKSSSSQFNKFLWVADTTLPGVVKIDLQTLKIVGRYRTGGSSTSRTTVNSKGEAFVGARSLGLQGAPGVTKVLPDGKNCPDTNKDGKITTSSGPDDVLPYGQDDCVAWHTATLGDIRGLAAQDIPAVLAKDVCKGFENGGKEGFGDPGKPPVDTPEKHFLWAGGLHGMIYKIDAETGQILLSIKAPSTVYGMALSGDGRLWTGQTLAFIDTNQCTDQVACNAAPVCTQSCSKTNCPNTCDSAVKAKYSGIHGYGITVDYKQRVWMSSGATKRFDPYGPPNQRLATGPVSGSGGIAADANGYVWAANGPTTVRIDAQTMQGLVIPSPNKGVAVDGQGRVFTVQNTGVHLITPGKTLADYQLQKSVVQLKGYAYAYSDMTGVQTRLASDVAGWYQQPFGGCDKTDTSWKTLEYDVEVPAGTSVIFSARVADTAAGLKSAKWVPIACIGQPGGKGIESIDGMKGKHLEVQVRFSAKSDPQTAQTTSARIKTFGVSYACGPAID